MKTEGRREEERKPERAYKKRGRVPETNKGKISTV